LGPWEFSGYSGEINTNAIQCGNYRDLSLFGAKEYTSKILSEGISTSIYGEDR
jgi:S-ribosylhomocysteine lyase LuxS involved in autoinducer biosynthesis